MTPSQVTKRYCYFVRAWNNSDSVEQFNRGKNPYTRTYSIILRKKLAKHGIRLKRLPWRRGAGFDVQAVKQAALASI